MGGEKPVAMHSLTTKAGSPPRGRGKGHGVRDGALCVGITPAWAGKRDKAGHLPAVVKDHPRMGGEKRFASASLDAYWVSPPRGRGKVVYIGPNIPGVGITPAWARKSVSRRPRWTHTGYHPRVGGEKSFILARTFPALGSPPHGRGKGCTLLNGQRSDRITPAWAGKSAESSGASGRERDHPRVGGEKISFFFTGCSPRGSPPRGRGKGPFEADLCGVEGITPACAGKRSLGLRRRTAAQDHPRVGGEKSYATRSTIKLLGSPPRGREKSFISSTVLSYQGSPPHGRGKVQQIPGTGIKPGITLAWAGKSSASQPWSPPLWMMVIRPRP